jgi:hypothetical protein
VIPTYLVYGNFFAGDAVGFKEPKIISIKLTFSSFHSQKLSVSVSLRKGCFEKFYKVLHFALKQGSYWPWFKALILA